MTLFQCRSLAKLLLYSVQYRTSLVRSNPTHPHWTCRKSCSRRDLIGCISQLGILNTTIPHTRHSLENVLLFTYRFFIASGASNEAPLSVTFFFSWVAELEAHHQSRHNLSTIVTPLKIHLQANNFTTTELRSDYQYYQHLQESAPLLRIRRIPS